MTMSRESLGSPEGGGEWEDQYLREIPVKITAVRAGVGRFSGMYAYEWQEVQLDPLQTPPAYIVADSGLSGTYNFSPAREKNNQSLTPPFYANLEPVVWSTDGQGMLYEFSAGQTTFGASGGTSGGSPTTQNITNLFLQSLNFIYKPITLTLTTYTSFSVANLGNLLITPKTGGSTIQGFTGGVDGQVLYIENAGLDKLILANNSGAAPAGSKIMTPSNQNYTLWPELVAHTGGDGVILKYDAQIGDGAGNGVWRFVCATIGGGNLSASPTLATYALDALFANNDLGTGHRFGRLEALDNGDGSQTWNWQGHRLTTDGTTFFGPRADIWASAGSNITLTPSDDAASGTVKLVIASSGGGGITAGVLLGHQVFVANGTYTPTSGMTDCIVECIGGGGGGGSGVGTGATAGGGGGGGSGGYSRSRLTSGQIGGSQTVTIGGAGTGGMGGNPGGNGGDTSLGTLVIGKGGSGGGGGAGGTTAAPTAGGAGGVAGTGDVNTPGNSGGYGLRLSGTAAVGGQGAGSHLGGAPLATTSDGVGNSAANNYGAGGSGACGLSGTFAGGSASGGIVIVWEFK